tara:strand:- start:1854 stop:2063 length:210 start_codon:yes stop_codon:yes gene_type:complete
MKSQETKDHEVSLKVGQAFREAYNKSEDHELIQSLLEQYKEARRAIPKGSDGTRKGSYEAYLSTQENMM